MEEPERFGITALTSTEMQKLRSDYVKSNSDFSKDQFTCISEDQPSISVSSCMSSYLASTFPLPHVPIIVNQEKNANLMVETAMLDTGSQISIANRS